MSAKKQAESKVQMLMGQATKEAGSYWERFELATKTVCEGTIIANIKT